MSKNYNPHLQAAMLEVVENQLAGNNPPKSMGPGLYCWTAGVMGLFSCL